mmetsp:Transcript_35798/g.55077  ORF Transcript_35798/g.55077 Transcript_35798/m.55077 type:complete len:204 (-) Transcript_35798:57-668(-)
MMTMKKKGALAFVLLSILSENVYGMFDYSGENIVTTGEMGNYGTEPETGFHNIALADRFRYSISCGIGIQNTTQEVVYGSCAMEIFNLLLMDSELEADDFSTTIDNEANNATVTVTGSYSSAHSTNSWGIDDDDFPIPDAWGRRRRRLSLRGLQEDEDSKMTSEEVDSFFTGEIESCLLTSLLFDNLGLISCKGTRMDDISFL